MIHFISSKQDFLNATNELHHVFQKGVDIVDNSFAKEFTIFLGFEFDLIYFEDFFDGLQRFLDKVNSTGVMFYTLLPDPVKYFYVHFSKYSAAQISIDTPYNDYVEFLNKDPGNSPADALIYNGETITMYSKEPIWGIIGSKDMEIGIVGFKDETTKNAFIACFYEDVFMDIEARLNVLDKMLKLKPEIKDIHSKIIKNYSRKK